MARKRLKMTKRAIAARRRYKRVRPQTRKVRTRHSKLATRRRSRRGGLFPQLFSAIKSGYNTINRHVFN